jgi:hypothetical protein
MKKILFTVFCLIVVVSTVAFSQWTYVKSFSPFRSPLHPNDLWGAHGVTVDPEGKIWVGPYDPTDTVTIGSGTLQKRREIFVFNPSGTKASFSPIKIILGDSLNNDNSARGQASDYQGNILYSSFSRIFKINYKTGVGIAKVDFGGGSITAAASDSSGNIFAARVAHETNPIKIFSNNLSFLANAVDSAKGSFSRTLLASGDGKAIYVAIFTSNWVLVYKNTLGPGFGAYALSDTILHGLCIESMAWQPRKGKKSILWASSGSRNNTPIDSMTFAKYGKHITMNTWYAYDLDKKTIVDSIKWRPRFPANPVYDDTVIVNQAVRPRGIAFTASGDTGYVAMYLADSNSIEMFKGPSTGVRREGDVVATTYTLEQNYPNPFNPSTDIKFALNNAGQTTLKVYDLLGREISTLVNERLNAGVFSVTFDASNLPSGTYFYTLNVDGRQISKKMMLLK